MFICCVCSKSSLPYIKPEKIILEVRKVDYVDTYNDMITSGWEIQKEGNICNSCVSSNVTSLNAIILKAPTVTKNINNRVRFERGDGGEGYSNKDYRNKRGKREFRDSN